MAHRIFTQLADLVLRALIFGPFFLFVGAYVLLPICELAGSLLTLLANLFNLIFRIFS